MHTLCSAGALRVRCIEWTEGHYYELGLPYQDCLCG